MDLSRKGAAPAIIVIFGATGDLTSRKLLPALYNLSYDGELPSHFACVGFARREKTNEMFRDEMKKGVEAHSRNKPIDPELWPHFADHVYYHQSNFDEDEGYQRLKTFLRELDVKHGTKGNRIFYLSTQPSYFPEIVEKLAKNGLIYPPSDTEKFSRVIIEKPFGHDLESAQGLQKKLSCHLDESQIYRIDHYLGKETVQNLLTFRFLNPIFEHLWNRQFIESIEITAAEELSVGTRGNFWEETGLFRDMIQTHVTQLLTLALMEPPVHFNANGIRDEKVKVLESVRLFKEEEAFNFAVRGQYGSGIVLGKEVIGYRQEDKVSPQSNVETFAAVKLFIDNWRWEGVPIYLRSGKRLTRRCTEIAITFKQPPRSISSQYHTHASNVLVIHVQPNEGISLNVQSKVPNLQDATQTTRMDFRYGSTFGIAPKEAYERLILDCLCGDSTLFLRDDEVIASWRIMTPIVHHWAKVPPTDFPNYLAGSNGPEEINRLLEPGDTWRRF